MDNQQATQNFIFGYLSGMIDGEGTIGCHTASTKYKNYYKPVIKIFNTDIKIIDLVSSYLKIVGISHHIRETTPKVRRIKYIPCYTVTIEGFKRVKNALEILLPYIKAKKDAAEVLLKICDSRLGTPMTQGNKNRLWTNEEKKLVEELHSINQWRKKLWESSQTKSVPSVSKNAQ